MFSVQLTSFLLSIEQLLRWPGYRSRYTDWNGLHNQRIVVWFPTSQRLTSKASTLAVGPTQLPVQRVSGVLFPDVKRRERETYRSPPCST